MTKNIAIIGGGISGIVSSLHLAKNKDYIINVFEKRSNILQGPPYCHLHAGGILYPEISYDDCQQLLHDSIQFANKFKNCLDYRPTIVAYRKDFKYTADSLIFKCKLNKLAYQFNEFHSFPFGKVDNFYAIYTKHDVTYFKLHGKLPDSEDMGRKYHDLYVTKFLTLLSDINSIQYPFISICEPGINQEKVEKQLLKELEYYKNINVITNKSVDIYDLNNYDTIINASGQHQSSTFTPKYELKSSWIIKSPVILKEFPEIAIIGERDTANGMIQLTPKNDTPGLFQVHYMNSNSTIIKTTNYPTVNLLSEHEIKERGNIAIKEIANFFPIFILSNVVSSKCGFQRIYTNGTSKRISCVSQNQCNNIKFIDIFTLKAGSIISLMNDLTDFMNGKS